MKQKTLLAAICSLITLGFCTGCASFLGRTTPPLNGIIYDAENKPVTDVKIKIDGAYMATSDIRGHFSLPLGFAPKVHTLDAEANGYETIAMEFSYTNPTQILYLRMSSGDQILDKAETAIIEKKWTEALGLLKDAEKAQCDIVACGYLRAIIYSENGNTEEAVKILEDLRKSVITEPYLELILADFYQFKLNNPAKAKEALTRYLTAQSDADIQKRMEELTD